MDTVNFSPWPEWQLTEKIGSGTYGSVYKCVRAGNDGAACAVKVIRVPPNESEYFELLSEGWSEEEIREHFRELVEKFSKEIDIMFRLQGTAGIVQIYDYKIMEDKTGSTLYIRMELLRSLDKYIPELIAEGKPLTEEQVLTLGVELCEGLAACRKENVIHRDIKPQNIFVTRDGHFKLGDFGIARRFYSMTGTMTGVGTPDFMAPEVWQGTQPGYGHTHYDYRADIYSLGLVLYKCLNNNHLPFVPQRKTLSDTEKSDRESAKSQAGQKRMRGEKLPAPSDASKAAAAAILRACEYWPADRWQSPEEFGSALLEARKALESSGDDRVAVKDHEDEQPPVLPAVNHGRMKYRFHLLILSFRR